MRITPAEVSLRTPTGVGVLPTLAVALLLFTCFNQLSHAQTFSVLYAFGAGGDGAAPWAGVTLDQAGNIYGTTTAAGHADAGTVWRLRNHNGTWLLTALHEFAVSPGDGAYPLGRVVFGRDGRLYGTTEQGGDSGFWGTVYSLRPPATFCSTALCYWDETILYSFAGGHDGGHPWYVDPVFDRNGNIYGTASDGGASGDGVVWELTGSGNNWSENVLHSFTVQEGIQPHASIALDHSGNIWGTTSNGNNQTGYGSVFELTPSGSGWTANIVHIFQGAPSDGGFSTTGMTVDAAGNVYGTTSFGGQNNSGSVFELRSSGGTWNYSLTYAGFMNGNGPSGTLVMDAAGNLYGTSVFAGAHGKGAVFKLTHTSSGWTYSSLHDFTGGDDGQTPYGGVTFDANGNLYGTASGGGRYGRGVVWKIVP